MDSAEKSMMIPLAQEAEKRGYKTKITDNKYEKCEIGVYCQHINHPQYSKFSVIMLHDIIQQYSNWPDIWFLEPWNKYDIGILPSNQWVKNWKACSHLAYARPRKGMFLVGWPKADSINRIQKEANKDIIMQQYHLDPAKKTVLYAPSWENDGKQDDFVKAMLPLNVNILIKQSDAPEEKFPEFVANVRKMAQLHKNIPGVCLMPPSTNIFEAIAISDVLVSEESSTMCEATMMGVPAVSVSDWLIPDVTPSRFPKCDYDFVTCTTKAKLQDCVKEILDNYEEVKKHTKVLAEQNFSNVGKSSEIILDIIDDILNQQPLRHEPLTVKEKKKIPLKQFLKHKYITWKSEFYDNYVIRVKLINCVWNGLKNIRNRIRK